MVKGCILKQFSIIFLLVFAAFAHLGCMQSETVGKVVSKDTCAIELIVLGAGQDAGAPQIGNAQDRAWRDPSLLQTATSIALVDHTLKKRYLFEATPQITLQLKLLDELAPSEENGLGLSGVFLTHAHIGHYAGLMFLGREAAGADRIQVHAMPRMARYLRENGPWGQLIELKNIELSGLQNQSAVSLSHAITVTPYRVPHRDEYSETVGFVIDTNEKSALFLPDIDSWAEWEQDFDIRLEDMLQQVDFAFVDSTFFDNNELLGRDMTLIPHPRVAATMDRLDNEPLEIKSRIQFIHYNHTNPIRFINSAQTDEVLQRGHKIARAGDRHCLSSTP